MEIRKDFSEPADFGVPAGCLPDAFVGLRRPFWINSRQPVFRACRGLGTRRLFIVALVLFAISGWRGAASSGKAAAAENDDALHIHMIAGAKEYDAVKSCQAWKQRLEADPGVTVTASWTTDRGRQLEDLDQLPEADLLVVFARRLQLDESTMATVRSHWRSAKPVIGIRTASHAFSRDENETFDKKVLGNHYTGHYGNQPCRVTNNPELAKHPILQGVKPFESRKLYKAGELPETTQVLQFAVMKNAREPVTLTHRYNGAKIFYTSLGTPEDFRDPNFQRLLDNAVSWATGRELRGH